MKTEHQRILYLIRKNGGRLVLCGYHKKVVRDMEAAGLIEVLEWSPRPVARWVNGIKKRRVRIVVREKSRRRARRREAEKRPMTAEEVRAMEAAACARLGLGTWDGKSPLVPIGR